MKPKAIKIPPIRLAPEDITALLDERTRPVLIGQTHALDEWVRLIEQRQVRPLADTLEELLMAERDRIEHAIHFLRTDYDQCPDVQDFAQRLLLAVKTLAVAPQPKE